MSASRPLRKPGTGSRSAQPLVVCPNGHLLNNPTTWRSPRPSACAKGIGVATTALYLICQIRVMKAASHAKASAGTLIVPAANDGIGLGAIVGGLAIPVWGPGSVGYVAALIALIAATAVFFIARLASRQSGPESWARQAFCAEPCSMQRRAEGALLFLRGARSC